jgi:serine/threonine protein kinase/tetratricopeptide (TPR) repeat protein
MALSPGTRLGPYEILAPLGAGGMGEVYRARDPRLGREIALKVLPADAARDPARRERFQREAKAVAALKHPNIVTIHSIEEADGVHFITMELIDGTPLSDAIPPDGLPLARFLEIAIPLADAVKSAHAKGVVHRDLKPANVMIDDQGRIKVLDFGLAKLSMPSEPSRAGESTASTAAPLTRAGALLGTFAYMSPEQIAGGAVDGRSDIFSLGTIFHEFLTGARPFRGDHPAAILYSIVNSEPPRLTARLGAVGDLVHRCLRKSPGERFASAEELHEALRNLPRAPDPGSLPAPRPASREKSIAVLPFSNVSADPENEYFADGMTEEIIAALSRVASLRVAARTSSFSFKNKNPHIKEVAAALSVGSVLEGSVRRSGKRVRITAQLVNVADGYQLWSERYDRELTDIFELQDEIAGEIARRLQVSLVGAPARERRTKNLEAYDLYLKGRFHWEQRGDGLRRALECFESAIALDPGFALAHAGAADARTALTIWGLTRSADELPRAKKEAALAVQLDPLLAEAHSALAQVLVLWDRDWTGAEAGFRRAIELDPRFMPARYWYGAYVLYYAFGRTDEAVDEMHRALEIDPLSLVTQWNLSFVLYSAGRTDRIVAEVGDVVARAPESLFSHIMAGWGHLAAGEHERATEMMRYAVDRWSRNHWALAWYAEALIAGGRVEEAKAIHEEMIERSRREFVPNFSLAAVPAMLGDADRAIEFLRAAASDREWNTVLLARWPWFDRIRSDPRFAALVQEAGLA